MPICIICKECRLNVYFGFYFYTILRSQDPLYILQDISYEKSLSNMYTINVLNHSPTQNIYFIISIVLNVKLFSDVNASLCGGHMRSLVKFFDQDQFS